MDSLYTDSIPLYQSISTNLTSIDNRHHPLMKSITGRNEYRATSNVMLLNESSRDFENDDENGNEHEDNQAALRLHYNNPDIELLPYVRVYRSTQVEIRDTNMGKGLFATVALSRGFAIPYLGFTIDENQYQHRIAAHPECRAYMIESKYSIFLMQFFSLFL